MDDALEVVIPPLPPPPVVDDALVAVAPPLPPLPVVADELWVDPPVPPPAPLVDDVDDVDDVNDVDDVDDVDTPPMAPASASIWLRSTEAISSHPVEARSSPRDSTVRANTLFMICSAMTESRGP